MGFFKKLFGRARKQPHKATLESNLCQKIIDNRKVLKKILANPSQSSETISGLRQMRNLLDECRSKGLLTDSDIRTYSECIASNAEIAHAITTEIHSAFEALLKVRGFKGCISELRMFEEKAVQQLQQSRSGNVDTEPFFTSRLEVLDMLELMTICHSVQTDRFRAAIPAHEKIVLESCEQAFNLLAGEMKLKQVTLISDSEEQPENHQDMVQHKKKRIKELQIMVDRQRKLLVQKSSLDEETIYGILRGQRNLLESTYIQETANFRDRHYADCLSMEDLELLGEQEKLIQNQQELRGTFDAAIARWTEVSFVAKRIFSS
jgi:hypothetical protein